MFVRPIRSLLARSFPPRAPRRIPPQGPLLDPLVQIAPGAGWLLLAGAALAMGAAALALRGNPVAALVLAAVAAPLAVLGALAGAAALWSGRALPGQGEVLRQAMQGAAMDPDPVLLTDAAGVPLAANPAAGGAKDPVTRLDPWCVDTALVVSSLLSEVRRRGSATREFWRQDKGLRVKLYASDVQDGLVVWHFSGLMRGGGRAIEALGLPVLSRLPGEGADRLRANAAARALLGLGEDAETAASSTVEALLADAGAGPAYLDLPGGATVLSLPLSGRDGFQDVVLLPARSLELAAESPREGLRDAAGSAFEDIPVALMQIGADSRIAGTNRQARALLGLAEDERRYFWEVVEGLGRPVADWLDDARAGRALGRPEVLRATLTGPETFVQIILRRATGSAAEGGLVAVLSDATEFKSLEARFVQSQKMQAIGQLAGGIAHDFNNLLTAISGHCDLLLLNRDRFDPDYNDLLQIHQNANRAAALVRQLLAFSRKQTLKHERVSLEGLLEELTHLLTRLVGERITLNLYHDPALGDIRADKRQLEQVIMNLVVNARDAMPMGGDIRIETEALALTQEREHGRARIPPGEYALIRVIDRGIGIPAEIIDKIFEPFFTTKKIGEGTGLGLSTAYGIVKQMGGYIFAESVEGAGTTFTLYFAAEPPAAGAEVRPALPQGEAGPRPAARRAARPPAELRVTPAPAAGGAILLVEDEAPVRAFAARALRLQGYQVFEAPDGAQALEFLQDPAIRVDLFVTDVIMPGIDGPGWVAEALQTRPGTPVVFVSGYTEDTLNAAMVRIPGAVFLGKPFSLKDLSETIARQLAKPGLAPAP